MVRLEETVRELKGLGKRNMAIDAERAGRSGSEVNKPYHVRMLTCIFYSLIANQS